MRKIGEIMAYCLLVLISWEGGQSIVNTIYEKYVTNPQAQLQRETQLPGAWPKLCAKLNETSEQYGTEDTNTEAMAMLLVIEHFVNDTTLEKPILSSDDWNLIANKVMWASKREEAYKILAPYLDFNLNTDCTKELP